MPFTAQDDEHLCYFLARIIPDKAAGGRLGLEVYKELLRTVGTYPSTIRPSPLKHIFVFFLKSRSFGKAAARDTHAWGARHTAESWKERYKKNAAEFDKWIEDIVKQEGRSRKQLWPEDRRVTHKPLRGRRKHEPERDSSDGNYKEEEEKSPQPPRKRRRSDHSPPPPPNRRQLVHSSDQQVGTRSSSGRKGKARALEEDELDQSQD